MKYKGFVYGIIWICAMMCMTMSSQPIIEGETEITRVNVVICIVGLGFGIWTQMKVMK